ncbi:FAD-binding oxidoreductase [Thermoproteota archaeon]
MFEIKEKLSNYQTDESAVFKGTADTLYLPENEGELCDILKKLTKEKTLATISGAGTSITGARVPIYGGAVISTEKMKTLHTIPKGFQRFNHDGYEIYINRAAKRAVAPGAIPLHILESILALAGFRYPPDPTEPSATLAGTVATNASGAWSYYFGPTRNWIYGLGIALPYGEHMKLKRGFVKASGHTLKFRLSGRQFLLELPSAEDYKLPDVKNAAGLWLKPNMDLLDLFIGSEGILGCFTDIEIGLAERVNKTLSVVIYFTCLDHCLDFVETCVNKKFGLDCLCVEFFDSQSLRFMKSNFQEIPDQADSAVLIELAYDDPEKEEPSLGMLARLDSAFKANNVCHEWIIEHSKRDQAVRFRHALPELVNESVRGELGKISTDFAVPHPHLREMMAEYKTVSEKTGIPYVLFGHIGNDHLHLNYLVKTEEEAERAKKAVSILAQKALKLGGTISAEHGVGKKEILNAAGCQVRYLELMYGKKGLESINKIKQIFDPAGILNAGNMIPFKK